MLLFKRSHLLLIVIGCIIPDLPWIFQRLMLAAGIHDPYDLRLYFAAQGSLSFCILACGVLALAANRFLPVFLPLSFNCLIHLLLDTTQIKYANGVHLLAPFSWEPFSLAILWPEHQLWRLLSVAGFILFVVLWLRKAPPPLLPTNRRGSKIAAVTLLVLYLAAPVLFMQDIEHAGVYHIDVLRQSTERTGKYIEIDRAPFDSSRGVITTFTGEELNIGGAVPQESGIISLQGRFTAPDQIEVNNSHSHSGFRKLASLIGLFMACALLLHSVILTRHTQQKTATGK